LQLVRLFNPTVTETPDGRRRPPALRVTWRSARAAGAYCDTTRWDAGAPALNTLRDLLHGLSRGELEAAFRRHAEDLASPATTDAGRPVIALDGKTL
jgi:hypothetical protein